MDNSNPRNEYVRVFDLRRGTNVTSIAQDVRMQSLEERAQTILDRYTVRRQEDWSELADKTVGAEGI